MNFNDYLSEEPIDLGSVAKIDLYTAFYKIAKNPILLETCIPGGISLLVWDPVAIVSVRNGAVKIDATDEISSLRTTDAKDVPSYLQGLVDKFSFRDFDVSTDDHPFIGGFVGFVGYEWMVKQEISAKQTEEGVQDLWFGLYDRAIVWDKTNRARLVAVPKIDGISIETVKEQFRSALKSATTLHHQPECPAEVNLIYDFQKEDYVKGVRDVKRLIRSGDVYQADIAQRIRTTYVEPSLLYERLVKLNPSPYSGIMSAGDFTIVSASPESLLKVQRDRGGRRIVSTRPIAGTRPRASGIRDSYMERSLRRSTKENAEHTMLVDLSRNDIGRVSTPGSVEVSELYTVERYSHVMHLVSEIKGEVMESVGISELFRSLFPGGSITGTPKIRSTEVISDIEPVPRGGYTGSMGYISLDGSMDFNILIRSIFFPAHKNETHLYAGSGIVQDSNPDREWEETRSKAAALIEAIKGLDHGGFSWSPPRIVSSWKPVPVSAQFSGARVILIDNYDSFTYNLVQYLRTLGAEVMVFRNDSITVSELKRKDPTHILISPGPGVPIDAGVSIDAIRAFRNYPILGVCLGHQAIVEAYGGTLKRAKLPMHGKTSRVIRTENLRSGDILSGMPKDFLVGRYHSLIAERVPPELMVTARTIQGEVMAIRSRDFQTFGVQFHPESILTPDGFKIVSNFLSAKKAR